MRTQYNPSCIPVNNYPCLTIYNARCNLRNMTLGQRLRKAREAAKLTQKQLAERSGVKQQTISFIETGKRTETSALIALARACGVRPEWLADEDGPMYANTPKPELAGKPIIEWETPEDLPEGQYVLVPRVSVRVSAGTGVVVYEEEPTGYLAFTTRWIKREHLSRRNLVVVEAVGDSMEPRIREGDILLVDRSQREVRDGKVYALRYGDQLRVKRLFRRYDGALILRSDNRELYPEEIIPPEALDDQIEIIGRVVWGGGGM